MHLERCRAGAALMMCALAVATPASAQETRAELLAREQAKKAQSLKPYEPSAAERLVTRATRGLVTLPAGFYPAIGSIYSGGGFSAGPGYRMFLGDRSFLDAKAMYSIRQYKLAEVSTTSPGLAAGRLTVRTRAAWLDATQVGFFGLGMDTSSDDRTNTRLKQTILGGDARLRAAGPLVLGGGIAYEDYNQQRGLGTRPSVEDRFTPAQAPGLGDDPAFVHLTGSGGIDWRTSPGYSRRGGAYGVTYHAYRDRGDTYNFNRVDAEVIQHLPILRETWVLSLRGRVQTTVGDTDVVPYFLMPALGGGSTLRAYSTGRFRDRHALLLQAEWRWTPSRRAVDMALFYDAGKVTDKRSGLDLDGLKSNVGIGIRFHGPMTTPLRVELARGREGLHLVITSGAAF